MLHVYVSICISYGYIYTCNFVIYIVYIYIYPVESVFPPNGKAGSDDYRLKSSSLEGMAFGSQENIYIYICFINIATNLLTRNTEWENGGQWLVASCRGFMIK